MPAGLFGQRGLTLPAGRQAPGTTQRNARTLSDFRTSGLPDFLFCLAVIYFTAHHASLIFANLLILV